MYIAVSLRSIHRLVASHNCARDHSHSQQCVHSGSLVMRRFQWVQLVLSVGKQRLGVEVNSTTATRAVVDGAFRYASTAS